MKSIDPGIMMYYEHIRKYNNYYNNRTYYKNPTNTRKLIVIKNLTNYKFTHNNY